MNKTFISLLSLVFCMVGAAQAQQSGFFVELGGGHTSNTQRSNEPSFNNLAKQQLPRLGAQLGFLVSSHSAVGLAYGFAKTTENRSSNATSGTYHSISENKSVERINSFGTFYRYYFLPFNAKRWNFFAELNPSFQTSRITSDFVSTNYFVQENDQQTLVAQETRGLEVDQKHLDLDLKLGGAYRIADNFHVQLSLRSIANFNYTPTSSDFIINEPSATSFKVFGSPFANAQVSLLFTL